MFFIDAHGEKIKSIEIFYIDFAKMCIENFLALVYIYELIYKLKKISLIKKKKLNSFKNDDNLIEKKVKRNELCPCGSMIKHKNCCGLK